MSCCGSKSVVVRGVMGVAKAVLRVGRAPDGVIAQRRDVCRICDHARKHPFKKTDSGLPLVSYCSLCKCSLRLKTVNAGEACPDGRWLAVEAAGENWQEA